MKSKKNIGLVGAGYWGKNLIRVFNELGSLKTVCDIDKKILAQRKKEYPDIKVTDNFNEILNDKEIKGVVIATPAISHYKFSKKALLSGKDVFVEKPLALKVKEAEELVKISKNKKLILMVGHLLLYHPAIIKIKELIKKGIFGDIRYIYSNRLNFGKLRTEENVLWSFAPHDIAVILGLIEDILGKPRKVTVVAVGKNYLQEKIADIGLIFLEFEKNKAAHIFVSWINPFKEQKLSIIGEKAMIVFDDQSENKLILYKHRAKKVDDRFEALKDEGENIQIPKKEPLKEEAKHFLDCIEERKNPITDGKEGLEVLKILDACQKSINNKGKPIFLKNIFKK
jgi:UDP-2-acetamido-3-amino-2,3-dideoxy-glucuronate N-acetyltransferase